MNWFRKMIGGTASRSAELAPEMEPLLKTVSYRGGVVTFRIPAHWVEEYEPDGGGTFYDKAPDSGTLRLQVITAEPPSPVTTASAPGVLAGLPQSGGAPTERLPNGCALVRYVQSAVERGERLFITNWTVAHIIPPRYARIATFSYTLLERQRDDARFRGELELLNREIRASIFSPLLGVRSV